MKRIPDSEWVPYAPDEEGSVRINHSSPSCSGSSKSLKITRTSDDRIYAKCYRCGGFGSTAGKLASVPFVAKRVARSASTKGEPLKFPTDFTIKISDMPAMVRLSLHKWGIVQKDCDRWKIGWSDKLSRLILPVFHGADLVGWQARYFGPDKDQPKYITRYKDSPDLWIMIDHILSDKTIVVVEDMISAIRVSKFRPALALLGLHLSDSAALEVSNHYDSAVVWTDYDSAAVRKKGIAIKEKLTMLGLSVTLRLGAGTTDPKHYDDDSLEHILHSL